MSELEMMKLLDGIAILMAKWDSGHWTRWVMYLIRRLTEERRMQSYRMNPANIGDWVFGIKRALSTDEWWKDNDERGKFRITNKED